MNRYLSAALAMAALTASACTDVLPPDDGGNGDFTVTVGSGTQPDYSWTGGSARRVDVVEVDNLLLPVWGVAANASSIQSPLRHGTVPSGTVELTNEQRTLRTGVRYRVNVTLTNGDRSSREFRP